MNALIDLWSYRNFNSACSHQSHSTFHRPCNISNILIYILTISNSTIIFLFWTNTPTRCCHWTNYFDHSQIHLANIIANFIEPSTELLKSWIIKHILSTYIGVLLFFFQGHTLYRTCYEANSFWSDQYFFFGDTSMHTTNLYPTVSKADIPR